MQVESDYYAMSWEQIGQAIGTSREGARRLFYSGMAKIRAALKVEEPQTFRARQKETAAEKQRRWVREWQRRNYKHFMAKKREWSRNNRDKVNAARRRWAHRNADKLSAYARKRYAERKKSAKSRAA